MSASELAGLIRERAVSSREVVEAHLRWIAQVNPEVNAITVVLEETALQAADAADEAVRSGVMAGPLLGVPVTVKENIDVAGSATTLGIVVVTDAVAAMERTARRRTARGRRDPDRADEHVEFGMRWDTDNDLRGPTRNPWSAGHTPGGSSGGDAVAVATGMAPLGLGNDGAGSLRWPAQCCGVTALKPSLGRVSQTGGDQPTPFAFQLLGVHGPIARRVSDLRLAFAHMCGRSGGDPGTCRAPLKVLRPTAPRGPLSPPTWTCRTWTPASRPPCA